MWSLVKASVSFIMRLSNLKWPDYMWKEQQSSPESRSRNKTAETMAIKDKKQTTTKGVCVLWKNRQSCTMVKTKRRAETDQVNFTLTKNHKLNIFSDFAPCLTPSRED